MPRGSRGRIPGGLEMKEKGGRRGRGDAAMEDVGGRGMISSVLKGALLSLAELRERKDGIAGPQGCTLAAC